MTSNPIPGWYGGVRYRSHTEMRWAMFFDHLELKYQYELQGYDTDGLAYLPDFVIYGALGTLWAEVKPGLDTDPAGIGKFRQFAAQRPQPTRAVLLVGNPSVTASVLVIGGDAYQGNPLKGPWEDETQEWRPCPSGHHFDLAFPGAFGAKFADDGCPDDFGGNGESRLARAILAANSYRFGHKSFPPGEVVA